jgi:hypothetical protein
MNKLLVLFSLILGVAAQAKAEGQRVPAALTPQKVSYTWMGADAAYSCDFAQREVEKTLLALGARDVVTRCIGGLPDNAFPTVDAKFISIRRATDDKATMQAQVSPVTIKFDNSCEFHEELIRSVLEKFEVFSKHASSSCWHSEGSVRYDVTVLK